MQNGVHSVRDLRMSLEDSHRLFLGSVKVASKTKNASLRVEPTAAAMDLGLVEGSVRGCGIPIVTTETPGESVWKMSVIRRKRADRRRGDIAGCHQVVSTGERRDRRCDPPASQRTDVRVLSQRQQQEPHNVEAVVSVHVQVM